MFTVTQAEAVFAALPLPALAELAGRGLATLLLVAATLVLLRRGGEALGGLVAAIPVTSAPALAWVGVDRGAAFAADASLAALYATGLSAIYAAAYALIARRAGRAMTLAAAAAITVAAWALTCAGSVDAGGVMAVTVLCFAAAFAVLPRRETVVRPRVAGRGRDIAVTAGVSGVLTVVVTLLAQRLPAHWCGLVAAIPVVGITTILLVHARSPHQGLVAFLRGYVQGLVVKACFAATLALALVPLGLAAGWVAAFAVSVAVLLGRRLLRGAHWFVQRTVPASVSPLPLS